MKTTTLNISVAGDTHREIIEKVEKKIKEFLYEEPAIEDEDLEDEEDEDSFPSNVNYEIVVCEADNLLSEDEEYYEARATVRIKHG
jgi:hypothetical protein